jgi:hypothetical protein
MMPRLLTIPERYPGRVIAAIGLLFALAYASSLVLLKKPDGRIVIGDAVHYYVYLRSAVFDHDLQFRDEYVRLYNLHGGEPETEWVYQPTATGHTRNVMSIGPALVWTPLYLLVTAGAWIAHAVGGGASPDGYERIFQASAGLSGVLAATLGAYAAYRAAAQLFGARAAIWSTLAMWLGGSAIYYSLVSPTYSHAASMLTVGLFVAVWVSTIDRPTIPRYALVGALGGLATLVRWQDAVLLIIPVIDAIWNGLGGPSPYPSPRRRRGEGTPRSGRTDSQVPAVAGQGPEGAGQDPEGRRPRPPRSGGTDSLTPAVAGQGPEGRQSRPLAPRSGERVRVRGGGAAARALLHTAVCGAAAVAVFSPQMLVWWTLYGDPFLVPQGNDFMHWGSPALLLVLFSYWHGLVTWTPVAGAALVGLVLLVRRAPLVGVALIAAFAVAWYTNAAVADWWAGEAFGSRRFVSCFPILVIGLAALASYIESRLWLLATLATVIIVANGLLLLQYQTFMHGLGALAPYPGNEVNLWLARFVVPFRLVRWWLQ